MNTTVRILAEKSVRTGNQNRADDVVETAVGGASLVEFAVTVIAMSVQISPTGSMYAVGGSAEMRIGR